MNAVFVSRPWFTIMPSDITSKPIAARLNRMRSSPPPATPLGPEKIGLSIIEPLSTMKLTGPLQQSRGFIKQGDGELILTGQSTYGTSSSNDQRRDGGSSRASVA